MKSRGLRAVLVLLAAGGLVGAGYFAYLSEVQAQAARAAQRAFERDVSRVQGVVAEIRASFPGYVAVGQDPSFWSVKILQLLQDAQARTASLERNGVTSEASQHIGTAEEAIGMLQQQDRRVRSLLEQGQPVEASQVIFRDVVQLSSAASVALAEAATLQAARTMSDIAVQRWNEIYALGGAAGVAFLVLLLLVPRAIVEAYPRRTASHRSPVPEGQVGLGSISRGPLDLNLRDETPPGRIAPPPAHGPRPAAGPAVPSPALSSPALSSPAVARAGGAAVPPYTAASGPAQPSPSGSSQQLEAAARLCTDLSRVSDSEQLQALLGRAATLLDAAGIIMWQATEGGTYLQPAFSYGYGPQALARMQRLGRNDENAVSAAFREGRTEVVAGQDGRNGGLVMPLLSSSGPIGVMAVETKGGGEARATTQALAAILAAQLATLMPGEQPAES